MGPKHLTAPWGANPWPQSVEWTRLTPSTPAAVGLRVSFGPMYSAAPMFSVCHKANLLKRFTTVLKLAKAGFPLFVYGVFLMFPLRQDYLFLGGMETRLTNSAGKSHTWNVLGWKFHSGTETDYSFFSILKRLNKPYFSFINKSWSLFASK